jgi:nicotinamidase-related amidase
MKADRSHLLIVDVQEKLVPAMSGGGDVVGACAFLAQAASHSRVPVLITEQYPKGLGHTVPELVNACSAPETIEKTAFSAAAEPKALKVLRAFRSAERRDQIVVCGVEAHVCVLQSCLDLNALGFEVFVVADGVSSRKVGSRDIALSRLARAGVTPVTSEMVAFEWVGDAKAPAFKPISVLVRER